MFMLHIINYTSLHNSNNLQFVVVKNSILISRIVYKTSIRIKGY